MKIVFCNSVRLAAPTLVLYHVAAQERPLLPSLDVRVSEPSFQLLPVLDMLFSVFVQGAKAMRISTWTN